MRSARTLLLIAIISLALSDLSATASESDAAVRNVWMQLVPPRVGLLRALTESADCPVAELDGHLVRMQVRAEPNSDFDILVCELVVPAATQRIQVAGRSLRPVPRRPQRIAVVADTGCRMKAGNAIDNGFQDCGDPDDWEFAKVAKQVASWKPDLIIQAGDYIYREEKCPPDCGNCQGSPFNSPGMRMDTWNVELFDPGKPMLEAAPIVFVRGDHEKCERAGRGFFRFLDPFAFEGCMDFSDPYVLDFEGLQIVVMDTVQADDTGLSPEVVIERYARDFERAAELSTGNTWLVSHRPIWALRPKAHNGDDPTVDVCGNQPIPPLVVESINVTAQEALAASHLSGRLPPEIDFVVTSHIHVGEVLSFTGRRPPQIVVGIGGTKLLPAVTDGLFGTLIDGEIVTHATMLSTHGFFGLTPRRQDTWRVDVVDVSGARVAVCRIRDKRARCLTR